MQILLKFDAKAKKYDIKSLVKALKMIFKTLYLRGFQNLINCKHFFLGNKNRSSPTCSQNIEGSVQTGYK